MTKTSGSRPQSFGCFFFTQEKQSIKSKERRIGLDSKQSFNFKTVPPSPCLIDYTNAKFA